MELADRDLYYYDGNGRRRLLARKGAPIPAGYEAADEEPKAAAAPAKAKARKAPENKAMTSPEPAVADEPESDE